MTTNSDMWELDKRARDLVAEMDAEMRQRGGSTLENAARAIIAEPALGLMVMRQCWATYSFEDGLRVTYSVAERILQLQQPDNGAGHNEETPAQ